MQIKNIFYILGLLTINILMVNCYTVKTYSYGNQQTYNIDDFQSLDQINEMILDISEQMQNYLDLKTYIHTISGYGIDGQINRVDITWLDNLMYIKELVYNRELVPEIEFDYYEESIKKCIIVSQKILAVNELNTFNENNKNIFSIKNISDEDQDQYQKDNLILSTKLITRDLPSEHDISTPQKYNEVVSKKLINNYFLSELHNYFNTIASNIFYLNDQYIKITNELEMYNPNIENNYINSVRDLYKLKHQFNKINKR